MGENIDLSEKKSEKNREKENYRFVRNQWDHNSSTKKKRHESWFIIKREREKNSFYVIISCRWFNNKIKK